MKHPIIIDEARRFFGEQGIVDPRTRIAASAADLDRVRELDPQAIGVSLEAVESGALDVVPRENYTGGADISGPTPARVPEWVRDPAKWRSMTRAERRAVERHHRRQTR